MQKKTPVQFYYTYSFQQHICTTVTKLIHLKSCKTVKNIHMIETVEILWSFQEIGVF